MLIIKCIVDATAIGLARKTGLVRPTLFMFFVKKNVNIWAQLIVNQPDIMTNGN